MPIRIALMVGGPPPVVVLRYATDSPQLPRGRHPTRRYAPMKHAGRFRLVAGAVAAALLAASALAFAPAPADAPKEEKIVFTTASREAKTVGIAIMNPDGSKRKTLTKD